MQANRAKIATKSPLLSRDKIGKKMASVNGSKELRVVIDYSYRRFGSTES